MAVERLKESVAHSEIRHRGWVRVREREGAWRLCGSPEPTLKADIGKLLSKGNISLFKTSSASQHAVSVNDGHYGLSFSH